MSLCFFFSNEKRDRSSVIRSMQLMRSFMQSFVDLNYSFLSEHHVQMKQKP